MKEKQLRRATTKSPTYGKCNSTFYFFLFFCRLKFANLIGENLTQTLISFIEEIIRAESYEISRHCSINCCALRNALTANVK